MSKEPLIGDIRIDPKYGPDTPLAEIYEFEIWDGQKWLPAATAHDILYHIGSGAGDGLGKSFREIKQEIKNGPSLSEVRSQARPEMARGPESPQGEG